MKRVTNRINTLLTTDFPGKFALTAKVVGEIPGAHMCTRCVIATNQKVRERFPPPPHTLVLPNNGTKAAPDKRDYLRADGQLP